MKRYMLFIVIFAIISIIITYILIFYKENQDIILKKEYIGDNENIQLRENILVEDNMKNLQMINNVKEKEKISIDVINNEKTLDLYGVHNENDIEISKEKTEVLGHEIEYMQISGLKNKNVENKINSIIKDCFIGKYTEVIKELSQKYTNLDELRFYYNLNSNFSNVISINYNYDFFDNVTKYNESKDFVLNFELINGNEIKFEDLFKKNEDLSLFVRRALYESFAGAVNVAGEWEGEGKTNNIRYDKEKGVWFADYTWNDENGKTHVKEIEYVPPMTEYDIEKKVRKFINSSEKIFYFTPIKCYMEIDKSYYGFNFSDFASRVVIYDKYVTDKDIYEKNDIGRKGVINCSFERDCGKYKETKYENNNLFYDLDVLVNGYGDDKKQVEKMFDNKIKDEIDFLKSQIERYKEIARNNLNKAYFVFFQSDFNIDYNKNDDNIIRIDTNLVGLERKSYLIECDIKDKQKVLDEILKCYRYYNLGFYPTVLNYMREEFDIRELEKLGVIKYNVEYHYYDLYNFEEFKSVEDIFINKSNYNDILKSVARSHLFTTNATSDLNNNVKYVLGVSDISVLNGKNEIISYINYSEIKNYIKIRELIDYYLEDISISRLYKDDLERFTKEALNIAYNQCFAKHGHDFKTKYLKDYFSMFDWYKPIVGKNVGLEELNDVEKYNVNLIKTIMDSK